MSTFVSPGLVNRRIKTFSAFTTLKVCECSNSKITDLTEPQARRRLEIY